VETAKRAGRSQFQKMLAYLKRHPTVRVVLVEKTDRLYRNIKDWVTVDELDLVVHLVKEGVVLSPESRSSEKFMHGIKVLMAKNFIDNLSEETSKGMLEKARQGLWPSCAPLGYRNDREHGTIVPDDERAPLLRLLFEIYSRPGESLASACAAVNARGFRTRAGRELQVSTAHKLLDNPRHPQVAEKTLALLELASLIDHWRDRKTDEDSGIYNPINAAEDSDKWFNDEVSRLSENIRDVASTDIDKILRADELTRAIRHPDSVSGMWCCS